MLDTNLGPGALALLQQGYRNNWHQYLVSLDGLGVPLPRWDICVLTASNAHQAEAYQVQLDIRQQAGLLPPETQFRVIADPEGQRIGSGGATLRVLSLLAQDAPGALANLRVLMIHSGGDSRRLPHCSATGKLFARVPHELPDGRPSSLFDEFLVSLSGLPGQIPPGVLVASGDVLLLFDHLQLTFSRPGITGVAAAAPAETGTHHGVYVTAGSSRRVHSFLHKPSLAHMRQEGALTADGQVAIDTGLVWFGGDALERVLSLAGQLADPIAQGTTINLYGDLLAPLAETTEYTDYLADTSDGPLSPALQGVRRQVWAALRGTPFSVESLHPAAFVHFGTSSEYLQVLREGVELFNDGGWHRLAASWIASPALADADGRLVAVNACVADGNTRGGCLLDTDIAGRVELGQDSLLANVITELPSLNLVAGVVLDQLPLQENQGYVSRLYGVHDNPKDSLAAGGSFLNMPWTDWLQAAGVSADELWPASLPDGERSLWNAALYPVGITRDESLEAVLWMQPPGEAAADAVARWRAATRLSLAQSYAQADVRRLVREMGDIEDRVRARRFYAGLEQEQPAEQLASLLGRGGDYEQRARLVADWLEATIDPWLPIRGYRALAVSAAAATATTTNALGAARPVTEDRRWQDRAFSSLARLVRAHTPPTTLDGLPKRIVCPTATVRTAARIDFGGGWTDTPPYSLERGGTVLNAAVTLWGAYPILAQAELLDKPTLILECRDIEAAIEPRFAAQVLNYANPGDPFALAKAALVYLGFFPADSAPDAAIADLLRPLGGGLKLSTSTTIPRGSGLGTSSILAGAILQCLANLCGQPVEQAQLFDQVLCLEQMITTGGGWQDQVGGLVGGVKLVTTQPGLPQVAHTQQVPLSATLRGMLDTRLLLIYTGQRRLAKDLLRTIMGRYMAREPEMVSLLADIAALAREMHKALLAEDCAGLGRLVAEHWEINKRMDPGCTNPFIDDLLAFCQPYVLGAKLSGAGGGGFAIALAHDEAAARELERQLQARYPQQVRVWPCAVADGGMVSA